MHSKTPEWEFLFNKVADLQLYEKDTLAQVFSCEYCRIFKNYFEKHLQMVSELFLQGSLLTAVKFSAVVFYEVFYYIRKI